MSECLLNLVGTVQFIPFAVRIYEKNSLDASLYI